MKGPSASADHPAPPIVDRALAAVVAVVVLLLAIGSGTYAFSLALEGQPLNALANGFLAILGFSIAWFGLRRATRNVFAWVLAIGLGIEWAVGLAALLLQRAKPDYRALGFLLTSLALLTMWLLARRIS